MSAFQLKSAFEGVLASTFGFDEKIFREFSYEVGTTPMSTVYFPLLTVIGYCTLIPLLQKFMTNFKSAPPLKYILIVHNLFLCVVSALLAFYIIVTLLSFYDHHHYESFRIFCALDFHDQRGSLTLAYHINHMLKYYELLDTVFLTLKHKKIGFLHAYHHPATLVLTWTQLVDNQSVQWTIILLNLMVHVVMYFYYFMSLLKIKMPWKKCVTMFQILQFVIDIGCIYGACIAIYFFGSCRSTPRAAIIGAFIITSYLYLFVDFYNERYKGSAAKKQALALRNAANDKAKKEQIQPLFLKETQSQQTESSVSSSS